MKQLTLVYPIRGNTICLGYKKRGFGEGNWNGYGGKKDEGETITECAIRELSEEAEVAAKEDDLEPVATLEFVFPDGDHLEVHTYFLRTFSGEPTETEEMKPGWFAFNEIPYEKMWADDVYWLPRALIGEQLHGKVWFDENNGIQKMEWQRVVL